MTAPYTAGTISLVSGSEAVAGIDTAWAISLIVGGTIYVEFDGGNPMPIATVDSDTEITAALKWTGPTGTYSYAIVRDTAYGQQTVANAQALATYIQRLNNPALAATAGVTPGSDKLLLFTGPNSATVIDLEDILQAVKFDKEVPTLADRTAYDGEAEGFRVLVANVGDGRSAFFTKKSAAAADWSVAFFISGPVGPTPAFTASASTLAAGAAATVEVNPTAEGYNLALGVPAGRSSGYPFNWSTTTTDANPGNGLIRANNASLANATMLFVSKTSSAGSALATFLLGLASSTNPTTKGDLTLQRLSDGAIARFSVTDVTDATNYVKIAVTGHSGVTALTNNGAINFDFSRAGDKGSDGAGTGDVVGPNGGVVDGRPVAWDGNTGKFVKPIAGPLAALHALVPSANTFPYFSGAAAAALADITPFARSILDDANGDAMFLTMGGTRSAGSNGWMKLPSGLIIQWGQGSAGSGTATIAYPMVFPNTVLRVIVGTDIQNNTGTDAYVNWSSNANNSNFTLNGRYIINGGTVGPGGVPSNFIAIGY